MNHRFRVNIKNWIKSQPPEREVGVRSLMRRAADRIRWLLAGNVALVLLIIGGNGNRESSSLEIA